MKYLIVNADDFGYSQGINQGIIEAHAKGIVTSTSLMVNGKAVSHALKLIKKYPRLSLGLHFQIEDDDSLTNWLTKRFIAAVFIDQTKKKFLHQVDTFTKLTGRLPDHIDSHHHVHTAPPISQYIDNWCRKFNIPYRGQYNFINSFPKYFLGYPRLNTLTVDNFIDILKKLPDGVSELMCHPARHTDNLKSSYSHLRTTEFKILTAPEIREAIKLLEIKLINWNDLKKIRTG